MNKIKKSILSVLLFSFVFLVVHDYVVHQTLGLMSCELCTSQECTLVKVDSKSIIETQLHDNIHNLLVFEIETPLFGFNPPKSQPHYQAFGFTSHISFVLERPPLLS